MAQQRKPDDLSSVTLTQMMQDKTDQTLKLSFTLYIASWLFRLSICH